MDISKLNTYAKFVFMSENSDHCLSTTDIKILRQIKYRNYPEQLHSIETGGKIFFDFEDQNSLRDLTFEIIDVSILGIVVDTEINEFGIDTLDCTHSTGVEKEYLFKVLVKMKALSE